MMLFIIFSFLWDEDNVTALSIFGYIYLFEKRPMRQNH